MPIEQVQYRNHSKTHMRTERYKQKINSGDQRTLRLLIAVILLLTFAIVAISVVSYRRTKDSLTLEFTDPAPEVEYGEEYKAIDFVAESNGDVKPSAKTLDTATLGSKEIVYTVSKRMYGGMMHPSRDFMMEYEVVDTTPPVILWKDDGVVLKKGDVFDINDVIAYGDNADPSPAAKVDGSVDMNTNGKYPLRITVKDASGNKEEFTMTVKVRDSVPPGPDTSKRTQFADFVSEYKGGKKSCGIDISSWQGDVDFGKVKEAGCEFVMIRIGYSSEGEVTIDSKFDDNFKGARDAGLKVGVYLSSYDNNVEAVRASAEQVAEKLGGAVLDLPVAFDWEDFVHYQSYGISFAELNGLYDVFEKEMKTAGYSCMLYSSRDKLDEVWKVTDRSPVWVANYAKKRGYKGPCIMWQACSTGRIQGISGDVDFDILYI